MAPVDRHPPAGIELGYARVSITKQNLERHLHALTAAGIDDERIYAISPLPVARVRPFGLNATLEGLDTAARKGNHGGRPAVITTDMLHAEHAALTHRDPAHGTFGPPARAGCR